MRRAVVPFVGVLFAAGCSAPPPQVQPPEPAVVTVEHPVERTLDTFSEFTGYLKAVESLEVRAQVTGYLKEVKYVEGGTVKPGDVLYEIDPEPYEAALLNAKAAVEKARADVANAEAMNRQAIADFARAEQLKSTNAIAQDEFDKRRAGRDSADAALKSAKATVDVNLALLKKAEFDRKNTTIVCDLKTTGRASRTYITKGNLVVAGQTVLCKLSSLDPIHAFWDVDEATSLDYRRMIFDTKELADPRKTPLKCWIGLKDEVGFPHAGASDYIDPEINRGTGTRTIRGSIPNADYRLSPGDSVRVKVVSGATKTFLTVPELAVGSQRGQKFVYVVGKGPDGKPVAEMRPVVPGPVRVLESGARVQVVETGTSSAAALKPADLVVVNGLLRVRPGAPINPQETPPLGK